MTTKDEELVERVARAISRAMSVDLHGGKPEDYAADDWQDFDAEARAAIEATRIEELRREIERRDEALRKIANHKSSVSDMHMECGNCHDAYLEDYAAVCDIARAALTGDQNG